MNTSVGLSSAVRAARRVPSFDRGPVRSVVTGRRDGYTGRVPFAALGGMTVESESLLEHDFLVLTSAFDRDLVHISAQPMTLPLWSGQRSRTWTPDFRLDRQGGRAELVEVKILERVYPKNPEARAEMGARIEKMREVATSHGYQFRLVTEQEIRVEPRLRNARLLLRYAGDILPPHLVRQGREALLGLPKASTIDALQERIGGGEDAFPIALHLDWLGEIEIDPARLFSRTSRFHQLAGDQKADRTSRRRNSVE